MNPETRKQLQRVIFFFAIVLLMVKVIRDQDKAVVLNQVAGQTMGTIVYNVKFMAEEEVEYKSAIDSVLKALNQSLSTYIPNSEISRFNRADTIVFDSELFYPMLANSQSIFERTEEAFDPTIGPLVNAWGFGPGGPIANFDSSGVDSLLQYVGYSQIGFDQYYATKPSGVYLDFSAIAKGYGVDLVGEFLEKKGIENYMVEIGGEVRTRGMNDKKKVWSIGIEDPLVARDEQKLLAIARLDNRSVATSGNYRNYYEKNGVTHAHIVDPRTGYSNQNNILSASVFASDCMTADAYATAFMVLGVEKSMEIVNADPNLEALLVYRGEEKSEVVISEGIKESITIIEPTE
ncbi:MAG: FAD:protein FMN transferase [Cyclobacteriaceae bacterium]